MIPPAARPPLGVRRGIALAALAALTLCVAASVGCAPMLAVGTTTQLPTARDSAAARPPGTAPGTAPPASSAASGAAAAVDTTPSPAALEVLGAIAEPLPAADRVPPPNVTPGPVAQVAPDTAADSAADDTSSVVPVPTPVPVLGEEQPGATLSGAPTSSPPPASSPPSGAAAVPPAAGAAPSAAAGASPSAPPSCWRVQIGAPKTSEEGSSRRDAAESLLLIPMVVERDQSLYKVRTRDCFDRTAADQIRQRAVNSGFDGAFLFDKATDPAPTAPKSTPKTTPPKTTKPAKKPAKGTGR